ALDDGAFRGRPECARCGGLNPEYKGFGTGLKPSHEPVVVARKPMATTVAANVLEHGTGALNIDASRIGTTEDIGSRPAPTKAEGWGMGGDGKHGWTPSTSGRWPANVILDEHMAGALDEQSGVSKSPANYVRGADASANLYDHAMSNKGSGELAQNYGDSGGASRFFYIARKDNECPSGQSSSTVSTAEMSSSGEGQPPASAPN